MVYIYIVSADVVNTLRDVLNERGWHSIDSHLSSTLSSNELKSINLNWQTYRIGLQSVGYTGTHINPQNDKFCKINHYLYTQSICKKDNLAISIQIHADTYDKKNIMRLSHHHQETLPSLYTYHPITFILPRDRDTVELFMRQQQQQHDTTVNHTTTNHLHTHLHQPIYILKPAAGRQGKDIRLITHISELPSNSSRHSSKDIYVLQQYISNPFLGIGSYKFDLRLYVLITSYHPLRIHLYDDGLVRFSSYPYSRDDYTNRYKHLTNFTINKYNCKTVNSMKPIIGMGCKWTIHQLFSYMSDCLHISTSIIWEHIKVLVISTILTSIQQVPQTSRSFELFGFDVMLDDTLKPWLLEVNASPALATTTWHDRIVKYSMLHSLLDAIGFTKEVTLADKHVDDVPTPNTSATTTTKHDSIKKGQALSLSDRLLKRKKRSKQLRQQHSPMSSPSNRVNRVTTNTVHKHHTHSYSTSSSSSLKTADVSTHSHIHDVYNETYGYPITHDFKHQQTATSYGQFECIFPFNDTTETATHTIMTSAASTTTSSSSNHMNTNTNTNTSACSSLKKVVIIELKKRLLALQHQQAQTQALNEHQQQQESSVSQASASSSSSASSSTDSCIDSNEHEQSISPSSDPSDSPSNVIDDDDADSDNDVDVLSRIPSRTANIVSA